MISVVAFTTWTDVLFRDRGLGILAGRKYPDFFGRIWRPSRGLAPMAAFHFSTSLDLAIGSNGR